MRIALIVVVLICSLNFASAEDSAKKKALIARGIGHELLLQNRDSVSRVLPIRQEGEKYVIRFEREFGFLPDDLVLLVDSLVLEHSDSKYYLVEVVTCDSNEVVYSFERDLEASSNLVPCTGRVLPKDCYRIELNYTMHLPAEPSQTRNLFWFVPGVLVVGLLLYRRLGRQTGAHAKPIQLGIFKYSYLHSSLLVDGETTMLTSKENELLSNLLQHRGEVVRKEELMRKIWDDQGSYSGRTLDVYVSRLRKKLEGDSSIVISNVKGIGYKLVLG